MGVEGDEPAVGRDRPLPALAVALASIGSDRDKRRTAGQRVPDEDVALALRSLGTRSVAYEENTT
ncbi:hypothetical protein [Kribbella sp. NPDC051718]|uniref:hypothetical protein n=1 Tax=Kribbella sp. NPDC051718 TaxID=3155168 RepID=UPI003444A8E0